MPDLYALIWQKISSIFQRPCQSATRRCHGQEVTQENAKLIRVAISLLLILMVTKTNERPITSLNEIVVERPKLPPKFQKRRRRIQSTSTNY
jgi:hypothetical protein